jgi:hypothetical protein
VDVDHFVQSVTAGAAVSGLQRGGHVDEDVIRSATAWMTERSVRNPERVIAMLAP